jgi:hypothetical protein
MEAQSSVRRRDLLLWVRCAPHPTASTKSKPQPLGAGHEGRPGEIWIEIDSLLKSSCARA